MLPWQDTTAHHEREAFIAAWQEGEEPVAALAHHFGVSRKTAPQVHQPLPRRGSRWPPRPQPRPARAPQRHPPGGGKPLGRGQTQGRRPRPQEAGPSPPRRLSPPPLARSQHRGAILDRAGLVRRRRRRRRTAPWHDPFQQAVHPNDCWCTDFKGWVRTGDGVRIDPLTIQDARSRYLLACQALLRPAFHQVRPVFERTFREYGLPLVIRSDNGPPFASTALGGLTQLAVWFVKLGVIPERIQPGHPEQNGRLERFHRTLNEEALHPVGPTPAGSSGSSTPTAPGTTTSGRTRPWARRPQRTTTALRHDPTPARSRARSTTPASSSAASGPMARSSGAGVSST